MDIDADQKKGYELTKDLDGDVFHVQVFGPGYEDGHVQIRFLDGPLKDIDVNVYCYEISG